MDRNFYPEERELKKIEEWDYHDFNGLMEYAEDLWKYPQYWKKGRKYYRISTGGWSGNESIIAALIQNRMFWGMCWVSSKRGGHYVFEIRKISKDANGKDRTSKDSS